MLFGNFAMMDELVYYLLPLLILLFPSEIYNLKDLMGSCAITIFFVL
jgi:hypothetical protein